MLCAFGPTLVVRLRGARLALTTSGRRCVGEDPGREVRDREEVMWIAGGGADEGIASAGGECVLCLSRRT